MTPSSALRFEGHKSHGAARRYYRHRHIGHFGADAAVVMTAVMVTMMTMGKDIVTLRGKDNRTKY